MEFTIGADPEVFLQDMQGNFISCHDILPGTKADPFKVPNGAVQVDGVAVEFNIDPANTRKKFLDNIMSVEEWLAKHFEKHQVTLQPVPVAKFDPHYFHHLPTEVKELGCDPDYNAYSKKPNDPPKAFENMRTGAGHIHFGWTQNQAPTAIHHMRDCEGLTKVCDSILYPMSTLWDDDSERRMMYGQVGSFRPKPYGMEYRVLSNAWLKEPHLRSFVYDVSHELLVLGTTVPGFFQKIIDNALCGYDFKTQWDWKNYQNDLTYVFDYFEAASVKKLRDLLFNFMDAHLRMDLLPEDDYDDNYWDDEEEELF